MSRTWDTGPRVPEAVSWAFLAVAEPATRGTATAAAATAAAARALSVKRLDIESVSLQIGMPGVLCAPRQPVVAAACPACQHLITTDRARSGAGLLVGPAGTLVRLGLLGLGGATVLGRLALQRLLVSAVGGLRLDRTPLHRLALRPGSVGVLGGLLDGI